MTPIPKASYWNERLSKAYASGIDLGLKREAKSLTRQEKMELAVNLRQEGKSVRAIARQLGVSKSTVWNWIKEKERKSFDALLDSPGKY